MIEKNDIMNQRANTGGALRRKGSESMEKTNRDERYSVFEYREELNRRVRQLNYDQLQAVLKFLDRLSYRQENQTDESAPDPADIGCG